MKRLILILTSSLPAFALMFNFGIYTMHDFHLFRQFEFSHCISDGIFPCRWAADSGLGYGEPVFNFYGQFPYWIGQLFHWLGFSIIDSTKGIFISSILLSGIAMYLFAGRLWGRLGGVISAIFYMYAPYRAVDVWVRGALPEALSFVFFPLIFLFLYEFMSSKKYRYLFLFSLCFSLLTINHNLSTYMISPFIGLFWVFLSVRKKFFSSVIPLLLSGIFAIFLASFYLLPVVFENSLTTVAATTQSYYNYQLHYATLKQVFLSRFWGYGGSVWGPNDTLSFSIGHLHWILPLVLGLYLFLFKKNRHPHAPLFFAFLVFGYFSLFLTHGKSEFIWKLMPGMQFVQFPWRYLSPAVFFLSITIGILPSLIPKYGRILGALAICSVISLNYGFYHPDIWRPIGDKDQFSGALWNEQRSSALQDYWPKSAPKLPVTFAPVKPDIPATVGNSISSVKKSQSASYLINLYSSYQVSLPIVYFPGWTAKIDQQSISIRPDVHGLISVLVPAGSHQIDLVFENTSVRTYGDILSLVALVIWSVGFIYTRSHEKT